MPSFECCILCTPPKRHIGCHSICKEYIECKEAFEKKKEALLEYKKQEYRGSKYYRKFGQR